MKRVLLGMAVVCAAIATMIGRPSAQSATLNAELLKDWTEQKSTMMKIADAMPEDKLSYKSTPPQRDYGQQILHVAGANVMYLRFFGGKAPAPAINRNATSKAEILKALADSFDYGTALIKEQTDQSMMQTVPTNQYLGPSSKARIILLSDRPHLGHLRADGGVFAAERYRAAGESAAVATVRLSLSEPGLFPARHVDECARGVGRLV